MKGQGEIEDVVERKKNAGRLGMTLELEDKPDVEVTREMVEWMDA